MSTVISGNSITTSSIDLTTPLSVLDGGTGSSVFETPVKIALNASGAAPIYACRAWVNFNGTGTVAIRASGNVSSITDNGVGDYTVNFITAMEDANYSVSGSCQRTDSTSNGYFFSLKAQSGSLSTTTTSVRVQTGLGAAVGVASEQLYDAGVVTASIFR